MTRPNTTKRTWMTGAAALLMLATTTVGGVHAQTLVYPRAGVSSDAYRTPPQRLSIRSAQPLLVQRALDGTIRDGASPVARPVIIDPGVVTIDHREPAADGQNPTSVRSELQKLYAADGHEMPQMRMRSYQQQRPAPMPQAATHSAPSAPPAATPREENEPGLLAGLFGFGRPRDTSRSSSVRRPPTEPAPFRPPTFRDQPRPIQPQQQVHEQQMRNQRPAVPLPQEQNRVAVEQTPAKAAQKNAAVVMESMTPRYEDAPVDSDAFFPADEAGKGPGGADETAGITSISDDLAEFFPEETAAAPEVPTANVAPEAPADEMKAKMQQLLDDHKATEAPAEGDGFQMPVIAGQEEIVPQPAPAAVSEYVATNVESSEEMLTLPSEPEPFFADGERAINPQERLNVVAMTGQTFDPSGTDTDAANRTADGASGSRMQQIAARDGVGLKGFCPVALRDERRLADGRAAYVSYHESKAYYLSSAEAKARFDAQPSAYAPASSGEDVTMKTLTGEVVEGSLDHSVWYKNHLYLFQSAENLKTFMAAPAAMAGAE